MESRWAGEDFTPALSLQLVQAKVQCLDVSDWQQNRIILGTLCKSAVAGFWQRQRGPSLAQEQAVTRLGGIRCSPRVGPFPLRSEEGLSFLIPAGLRQTPGKGTALIFPDFGGKQEPSAALITLCSLQSPAKGETQLHLEVGLSFLMPTLK